MAQQFLGRIRVDGTTVFWMTDKNEIQLEDRTFQEIVDWRAKHSKPSFSL